MKKQYLVHSSIILGIVLVLLNSVSLAGDIHIHFGYSDAEAFPFQIRHDVDPPGIAIEIIDKACKDLGMKAIFIRLPNKRVQASLSQGIIDGAFMYSFKTDREINGRYPMKDGKVNVEKRLATLSYYLYKLKGNSLQWDGENFSGVDFSDKKIKIGANLGYSIVSDLNKMGVKVDEGGITTDQNFMKLLTGRIIGYAHQDLVADNYIITKRITTVEKLSIPIVTKPYFLMFSHQYMRKNQRMAERTWSKIAEIRDVVTNQVSQKYSK